MRSDPRRVLYSEDLTMTGTFGEPPSALALTAFALSGYMVQGAPSFALFGAYFPAWMFCAALGILVAILARAVFVATGLAHVLPFQLFVCASIGLCAAVYAGMMWLGQ
jgi:YtcA family